MNPFLAAYANSYDNGQKLYEDLPTSYQGTPAVDNSGFSYGGQTTGTAGDVTSPIPYQPAYTTSGMFGSGVATPNRTPEQLATIKSTWEQFSAGKTPATAIKQAMEQYGVNFADIAAATGQPITALVESLNKGLSTTTQAPQQAATTPPKPTYGSPYNPDIITPNTDGSGRPAGSTHPASGMVNLDTTGQDYNTQMQNYYKAYYGGNASPDMGMLNSWYNTPYTPPVTGYVKPTIQDIVQTLPFEFGGSGGNFNFGGSTANTGSGSSSAPGGQGVNQTTAAGALAMMAASENPAIRALSPAVAALLGFAGGEIADGQINGMSAADAKLAASKALQDMGINTISDIDGNIRTISTPDSIAAATEGMFGGSSGSGGRMPGFGSFGNSSFGEGQY